MIDSVLHRAKANNSKTKAEIAALAACGSPTTRHPIYSGYNVSKGCFKFFFRTCVHLARNLVESTAAILAAAANTTSSAVELVVFATTWAPSI